MKGKQAETIWVRSGHAPPENFENLKEQCHEDFAVLGQFSAKVITLRL